MEERKAASLKPKDFSPSMLDMSLEEVIRECKKWEKERKIGTEPEDSDRKHIRAAINELASSVKQIASNLGVSQSVLTKCMARHLYWWYSEGLSVERLSVVYNKVFQDAKKGHTAIRKQMEKLNFTHKSEFEEVNVLWEIPNFIWIDLVKWSPVIGAEPQKLLVHGMAWSLSMLDNIEWDEDNIREYFLPEVKHMTKMVRFREIDIDGFRQKIEVEDELSGKVKGGG